MIVFASTFTVTSPFGRGDDQRIGSGRLDDPFDLDLAVPTPAERLRPCDAVAICPARRITATATTQRLVFIRSSGKEKEGAWYALLWESHKL